MWGVGFGAPLYILGGIFIQPIPTVMRFLGLPVLRFWVFFQSLNAKTDGDEFGDSGSSPKKDSPRKEASSPRKGDSPRKEGSKDRPKVLTSTLNMAVETEEQRNTKLRRRRVEKKREDEKQKEQERLLEYAEGDPDDIAEKANEPSTPVSVSRTVAGATTNGNANTNSGPSTIFDPDLAKQRDSNLSALQILQLTSTTPNKARMQVAAATQFDLLLPLTKPIIPLLMLICTGQVWSGIWTSMIVSQILRSWVPKFNYETHHLISFIFGFLHTLLGVSASQVEQHAESGASRLMLQWEWSFKDLVSIVNMIMIGAFVFFFRLFGIPGSYILQIIVSRGKNHSAFFIMMRVSVFQICLSICQN